MFVDAQIGKEPCHDVGIGKTGDLTIVGGLVDRPAERGQHRVEGDEMDMIRMHQRAIEIEQKTGLGQIQVTDQKTERGLSLGRCGGNLGPRHRGFLRRKLTCREVHAMAVCQNRGRGGATWPESMKGVSVCQARGLRSI